MAAAAARKIKDTKHAPEATKDVAEQLQRLMPKQFLAATPWAALQHFPRYHGHHPALDKPARRSRPRRPAHGRSARARPALLQLVAERKGQQDARLQELRWLLQELRVSFFGARAMYAPARCEHQAAGEGGRSWRVSSRVYPSCAPHTLAFQSKNGTKRLVWRW